MGQYAKIMGGEIELDSVWVDINGEEISVQELIERHHRQKEMLHEFLVAENELLEEVE